jgi:bifunctional non-homologous end joining protein LigD
VFHPVIPFEPVSTDRLPTGEQWTAQVKFDGVRMLTYFDGTNVRLFNRRLHERTNHYSELTQIASYCSAKSVILDGEVVAFEQGKPSFYQVMKRDSARTESTQVGVKRRIPIAYMVFDILHLNGKTVTDLPLRQRQCMLAEILIPQETVHLVDSFHDATKLFQAVTEQKLEGIVIKDLESSYQINGKDGRWQKRKHYRDLVAVVGGVTLRDGVVNALLLGMYDEADKLQYIGKAGSGHLTQGDWQTLTRSLRDISQQTSPFAKHVPVSTTVWLMPLLTVKVQFLEWNRTLTLRHPTIQSFTSTDPRYCRFDPV